MARRELLVRGPAGLDRDRRDGRTAPARAIDAGPRGAVVRPAAHLRARAKLEPRAHVARARRLRPERGDDLADGRAVAGGGLPVPDAGDGRANARRLWDAARPDGRRRPHRARGLFAHGERVLRGRPRIDAAHRNPMARQHVAACARAVVRDDVRTVARASPSSRRSVPIWPRWTRMSENLPQSSATGPP